MNFSNFRNFVGYCLENARNIHVCGYDKNRILFQIEGGKMKKSRMYENSKGVYFTVNSKRIYIVSEGV